MLTNNQENKQDANILRTVSARRLIFILIGGMPRDFFVVVGVLVAVKSPVRISVVVVTVTLDPPTTVTVAVEPGELQSEDAS